MKYFSMIAFLFFMFSCYGWGYALVSGAPNRDKDSFAFLSVIGIACLVFIGGVLNLVRLAYPAALKTLLLLGLVFFAISYFASAKMWLSRRRAGSLINAEALKAISGNALPIVILAISVGFFSWALLPAGAFNYDDDFLTYIPRSLRMLQTGTMTGDPFELLGKDIGAHAFLHGFVLLGFPIEYLLGFDAVFSFALAGMLLIAIGNKFNLHCSYTAFALLGFIVINPQAVNISALYTGSAMILGILIASCLLLDQIFKSRSDVLPCFSIGILGLLIAGAIAIKTSFASYVSAYFAVFFVGLLLIANDKRKVLKIGGLVILSTLLALLPWLALHAGNYASSIEELLDPSTAAVVDKGALPVRNIIPLFSANNLFYGNSYLSYGIIVLMLLALGSYGLMIAFGKRAALTLRGYFLVAAASCTAGIVSYFFNALYTNPQSAVRYSCPVLIAALPFAWLAASTNVPDPERPEKLNGGYGSKMTIMIFLSTLIVFLFFSNFISRVERAFYRHTTLSFPVTDSYMERIRYTTSPEAMKLMREIQFRTQPEQKILAWVDMPGNLDFSRNEIYAVGAQGLRNPWVDMPLNGNISDMIQYLKGMGIRYIIFEYSDIYGRVDIYRNWIASEPKTRFKTGVKALYFRKMLALMMKEGGYLYNANGIVLLDLQEFV